MLVLGSYWMMNRRSCIGESLQKLSLILTLVYVSWIILLSMNPLIAFALPSFYVSWFYLMLKVDKPTAHPPLRLWNRLKSVKISISVKSSLANWSKLNQIRVVTLILSSILLMAYIPAFSWPSQNFSAGNNVASVGYVASSDGYIRTDGNSVIIGSLTYGNRSQADYVLDTWQLPLIEGGKQYIVDLYLQIEGETSPITPIEGRQVHVTLNKQEIFNGRLNAHTPATYDFFTLPTSENIYYNADNKFYIKIPIDFNFVKGKDTVTIAVDDYTSWKVNKVCITMHFSTGVSQPAYQPYIGVLVLVLVIELIFALMLTRKLCKWGLAQGTA
jgi:hypothetical protein